MGNYAVRYALRRAGYAPTEIRVLDSEQNVIEVVPAEDGRALVSGGLEFRNSGRKRRNAPVTVAALTMRHSVELRVASAEPRLDPSIKARDGHLLAYYPSLTSTDEPPSGGYASKGAS